MRQIKLDEIRRVAKRAKLENLEKAQEAMKSKSPKERDKFVKDNDELWASLKYDLWNVGNRKCWYSEKIIEADAGEVEHFRPKKKVWKSSPPHNGYWWHAFDWKNFRLAHPLVNKRRKDYSTEVAAGKGCYFPLRTEINRAIVLEDEHKEEPALLDPVKGSDCFLICFDMDSGRPIPRFSENEDPDGWLHSRALQTINFYHLDEGTWNAARSDLMRAVAITCDKAIAAKKSGNNLEYVKLVGALKECINAASEFSMAAEQVLCEKGLM